MHNAGPILEELYSAVDAISPDAKKAVLRALNIAYRDIAELASWSEMRRSITATGDTWLPADIIDVDAVYDANGNIYHRRDKSAIYKGSDDYTPRYYIKQVRSAPLSRANGVNLTEGNAAVSFNTANSEAVAGAYMTVANVFGFWKLAGETSLEHVYNGPNISGGDYTIGPSGTKQIAFLSADGTDDTATPVTIDYWAYPQPIYGPNDAILLPGTEALVLRTLRRYYKVTKMDLPRGVSFNDEYEGAMSELMIRNQRYSGPVFPKLLDGSLAAWGAQTQ